MFKGRLGIWIFVIILCVGGTFLIDNVPKWMETEDIFISSKINDSNVVEKILDNRYGDYIVKTNSENSDIIIASTLDEASPNYTVKKDFIYSPLVMYVQNNASSYDDGLINVKDNYCYKIDLMTVLDAMEKDKTWQDIGFNEKVVSGDVALCIPNKSCWYYKDIENLFYLTLNGGKTPTDDEMVSLKPRVDALIKQCDKVISIESEIEKEANELPDNFRVFIAPESLYMTGEGMGNGYTGYYIPIYFTKTIFISADLYINNNSDIAKKFIDTIQTKKTFMKDTGWRVKDSTFDISNISDCLIKVPT